MSASDVLDEVYNPLTSLQGSIYVGLLSAAKHEKDVGPLGRPNPNAGNRVSDANFQASIKDVHSGRRLSPRVPILEKIISFAEISEKYGGICAP